MLSNEPDSPYRAPVAKPEVRPVLWIAASERDTPGARLLRLYLRLIGGLQVAYSLGFGWLAFSVLASFVGRGGINRTDQDVFESIVGPLLASTSASAFFAGIGLLRLRRWARPWEIAYLGICFAAFATATLLESAESGSRRDETGNILAVCAALTVPFLPVLWVTRSRPAPSDR